jgi:hypothetical protein
LSIERNGDVTMWMNLENIMLSKRAQLQKIIYSVRQIRKDKKISGFLGLRGWGWRMRRN